MGPGLHIKYFIARAELELAYGGPRIAHLIWTRELVGVLVSTKEFEGRPSTADSVFDELEDATEDDSAEENDGKSLGESRDEVKGRVNRRADVSFS